MTRLNGVSLGRVDEWLPAIISFVFLIVACSSPPFLFSPLPFVCLTLLLSIWPTIDKTQSLTMLGALHRIGGDGACTLWRACVSVRALGRRWDATHVIVYLPFHFQMALSRKNVLLDTLSLSLPRSFPSTSPPAAHSSVWTVFRVQNAQHEVRGKVVREPGRQTGT